MTKRNSPRSPHRAGWSLAAVLVALSALIACTEPVDPALTPPRIASFSADPVATVPGGFVSLSWEVAGEATLRLMPGAIDISGRTEYVVSVDESTTFVLVAENEAGTAEENVFVAVGTVPTIDSFTTSAASGGVVNPGLGTTLTWATSNADSVTLRGPGLGDGIDVTGTTSYAVTALEAGAVYTIVAANDLTAVELDVLAARAVPAFSVLIAGQSNAQGVNVSASEASTVITADPFVRMLGNDYVWKGAYEPLDDCTDQDRGDLVNADPNPYTGCAVNNSGVSSGVSLGNRVAAVTGGTVFLIPAPLGGSGVNNWLPRSDRYDRASLFGSAANRARLADLEQGAPLGYAFAGEPYGAIVWYQGETDSAGGTLLNAFEGRTRTVLDTFRAELGAPTFLVQLSRRGYVEENPEDADGALRNLNYQRLRETQRRLATGARLANGNGAPSTLPDTFLIVTHDLPLHPGDGRHISAWSQVELGRRISLAIREHLFGESVDGSGPQLVAVVKSSGTVVRVHVDRPIRPPGTPDATGYGGYFAVFSDGQEIPIQSIALSGDARTIQIGLAETAPGDVFVRYMPPPGIVLELEADVVRSATCGADTIPGTTLCLPMAAFGDEVSVGTAGTLRTFRGLDEPQ